VGGPLFVSVTDMCAGCTITRQAANAEPAARLITVATNAAAHAVDLALTERSLKYVRERNAVFSELVFSKLYDLPHDTIGPMENVAKL